MFCVLKADFAVSGSFDVSIKYRVKGSVAPSIVSLQFKESNSNKFMGKTLSFSNFNGKPPNLDPVFAQSSVCFGKSLKWWEKSLQPNMIEIQSAEEFVDYLVNAGDILVIVYFYSPGCGGCKSLHPKICQLAESNPNTVFLKVNYEQHKAMCYALHVHVLPFFRFYRGAEGRICSFSCTNATIKKFKDALAKHGTDRCTLGPVKGLDETELLALASIGLISEDLVPSSINDDKSLVLNESDMSEHALSKDKDKTGLKEGNDMVMA